jgi:hypothetical protein
MCHINCKYENYNGDCRKPYNKSCPDIPFLCLECDEEIFEYELINNKCPHCGYQYGK